MLALSEQHHAQRNSRHNYVLYMVAAVISVLLSTWINMRETVINPDAICYLLSAQTMTEHGFKAGMQFCPQAMWPFYSFLVSAIVRLTHVPYQFAAYALDGLFTVITVITFIAIIDVLGASRRVLWLAAAVILLSHEFNYVRQYIVRDHGFWAFYLLSLFFMLKSCHPRAGGDPCNGSSLEMGSRLRGNDMLSTTYALAWSISLAIATLFRIEGAIFILALPFAAFFLRQTWSERFKAFFMLNSLTIVAGAALVAWVASHPENTMEKLGRLPEVTHQLQSGVQMMVERYDAMRMAVIEHVLTLEAARDASLVLVLMLLSWYLLNVIGNLSWIYSGLVVYAWVSRAAQLVRPARVVLVAYLLVNLVVTLCFFAEHLFLAKRYLIALTLTLMIWVPYGLDHLIEMSTQKRYRVMLYVTTALVFISALGGIFDFGYSKLYIRQAGHWLALNVPAQAKLYVNDPQLMYYSEHNRDVFFKVIKGYVNLQEGIADGKWKQYDYVALRLSHHPDEKTMTIMRAVPLSSMTEFVNKRGDKVIVYKVNR